MKNHPISVIYDSSTNQNREDSASIIVKLSNRGICFHGSKSSDGKVALIVDEHRYSAEYIREHEEEVLDHAKKVSKSYLERRLQEIEARMDLSSKV